MTTAVLNVAEAAKKSNGISEGDAFDILRNAATRHNTQFISADKMNAPSATDETSTPSQSEKGAETDASRSGSAEGSRENKENELAQEAPKNRAKRKFRNVLDSDSEKEDDFISSLLNKSYAEEPLTIKKMGKNSRRLLDSESEAEDSAIAGKNTNNEDGESSHEDENLVEPNTKKTKISSIVDSTSDEEEDSKNSTARLSSVKNKKEAKDRKKKAKADHKVVKSRFRTLVDSESEEDDESPTQKSQEENQENITGEQSRFQKSKISSLIDTDSEDDGNRNDVEETPRHENQKSGKPAKTEKSTKKRTGSIRASKDEAMRQIHSETQRLIRSSEVSLPYHRPKQRSLQEFLNRKRLIPTLPEGLTTAAKVKMSTEIVGKVLEEKEKEAELFYKSSDSEDETETSSTPADSQAKNEEPTSDASVDHQNIEDTQKLLNNDVQNAHNKKEIIQQCGVDLGVPRKLFANGSEDFTANKSAEPETEPEDPRKKAKETKHGLREASVPRKLFANDSAEAIAPLNSQEIIAESSQSSEIIETLAEPPETSIKEISSNPISEAPTKSQLHLISSDKNTESMEALTSNTIAEKNTEFCNISDTPFISNKEIARLNEKGKISRNYEDPNEKMNDDDSRNAETEIRHVEKTIIKPKLQSNVVPKLRGAPGLIIDLSDDVKPNPEGVQSLVDRLMRHSASIKSVESSASVSVIHTEKTADGLKIAEQKLSYKSTTTDSLNDKELSKPGAKYVLLKKELIEKIAKKRNEEWRLKEEQEKGEDSEEEEEIDDEEECEIEEETLREELEVSGESEPEENDLPDAKEKKRKNRDFADEEAEVSGEDDEEDEENEEEMEIGDADDEDEEDKRESEVIDEDDDTRGALSNAEDETSVDKPKKLSRIVRAFEDDSNSLPENAVATPQKPFERTKTDVDIFANEDGNDGWMSDTEAEIPPSQIPRDQIDGRSQLCKTPLTAVNILRFVSPITQLTAFDSCNESPKESSASKHTPRPFLGLIDSSVEKTPLTKKSPSFDSEKRNGFQKKLFEDPSGTVNDEELMDLCSGRFTGIEQDDEAPESAGKLPERQSSDLCSGSFLSKGIGTESFEKNRHVVDEASQDIKLTLDGESEDSRDKIINEETANKPKTPWANFRVASSSDEENSKENRSETNGRKKKLKKKKVKQLELSDEEEEQEFSEEEENAEAFDNDDDDKYVDYDSEENEVVIVPKKDIKKVAARFLDEEAELSESEWGSADEDEKELDKLEVEEGDNEEIDENQMRDQIGKMHMRQVLDDDQREVRMLQELLFDDGDLHTEGSGRERQFKWKNIDNFDNDDNLGPRENDLDGNGEVVEDEYDLAWRQQRREREMFLEEEKKKLSEEKATEELASDSQIFKLGLKALEKIKSKQISQKDSFTKKPFKPMTVLDLEGCTTGKNSSLLNKAIKRGSFLARGDECLARLALSLKEEPVDITRRQNTGNFAFAHLSPAVADNERIVETDEDSQADENTKKRKPPSENTPRTAKKPKIEVTHSSGKKLF